MLKGINAQLGWGHGAVVEQQTVDHLVDLGVEWVRIGFNWRYWEYNAEGDLDLAQLAIWDREINLARDAGLKILMPLIGSPTWAGGLGGGNPKPPTNLEKWRNNAVVFAMQRWKPDALQCWNEPNQPPSEGVGWNPAPDPAAYVALLKVTYEAVKSINPETPVVAFSVAHGDYQFIEDCYDVEPNLGQWYDVVSCHPYALGAGDDPPPEYVTLDGNGRIDPNCFTSYREVRDSVLAAGDIKPLWLTEFGWSTSTGGVSEVQQADYLTRAYNLAASERFVGAAFWYQERNDGYLADADTWIAQLGLTRTDWTPKLAYAAYKALNVSSFKQFATELYARLAPWAAGDEDAGWPLRNYVDALSRPFEEVELYGRSSNGSLPWSLILDLDHAPSEPVLRWLAQLHGVRLPQSGLTLEELRQRIKDAEARRRGTVPYLVAVAQRYLTGTKSVAVTERYNSAYGLRIVTQPSETPDSAALLKALLENKPAGITLYLNSVAAAQWDQATSTWNATGLTWSQSSSAIP